MNKKYCLDTIRHWLRYIPYPYISNKEFFDTLELLRAGELEKKELRHSDEKIFYKHLAGDIEFFAEWNKQKFLHWVDMFPESSFMGIAPYEIEFGMPIIVYSNGIPVIELGKDENYKRIDKYPLSNFSSLFTF